MSCKRHYVVVAALAALIAGPARAGVFYTQTVPANPLGGDPVGSEFPVLDDVQIRDAQNPFHLPINVTKVTFGIVQNPGATAVSVTGYYGAVVPDIDTDADDFPEIDPPISSFGSAVVVPDFLDDEPAVYNAVIGTGLTTLFTITPNFDDHPGFGELAVGLLFSDENTGNAWGLVDLNSTTLEDSRDGAWFYDFTFGEAFAYSLTDAQDNPVYTTFLMTIEGELVPEPASIGVLGIASVGLLAHRRRGAIAI